MTHEVPRTSGIYQIKCIPTGKIYIGSAFNLRERWQQHRRSLNQGCHHNPYLQQAWLKYDEASFEFSILEFVDKNNILAAEQNWIDKTGCTDRSIGFNVSEIAGSPGSAYAKVWEGFTNPEGIPVDPITNLQAFCHRHNLCSSSMVRLAKGKSKLKSYKGWTHSNSVRQRDYIKTYDGFIDPDGNLVEPITNLAEFCRAHELDNTHMVAVANGRICSHRGWTHKSGRTRQNSKTYTHFVNPNGKRVVISNLAEFCRENGLHPVKMHNLKSGKIQRYKGWTWREEQEHGE